jgi:RNA 2',3'-cyclic 3'-phosphodiesterase
MEKIVKQLFLGFAVGAPWSAFSEGKILEENDRHLTFLFLGKVEMEMQDIPEPPFIIAPVGIFDRLLFIPEGSPRVAAFHATFLSCSEELQNFRQELIKWADHEEREMLPHVTVARQPKNLAEWKKNFKPLPFFCKSFHLYQSLGDSHYEKISSHSFLLPFEELSHTADIAFLIRGKDFDELFLHAQIALAFSFPALLAFIQQKCRGESLDELVIQLNEIISSVDQEIGCPFKAVSFHGKEEKKEGIIHWEMIVDV